MTRPKANYVADEKTFANSSPMSLTLRQLHGMMSRPIFWIVVATAILLTAMAGPYFTLERLSFPERLIYWGTCVPLSAVIMTFLSILSYRLTEAHALHWVLVSVLSGLVGILPVVGAIYLSEGLAAGFAPGWAEPLSFFRLSAFVAPSLMAVTLTVHAMIEYRLREDNDLEAVPKPVAVAPTLLQSKLPHHLGHDIVAVQAQDHYVEVTTPKGNTMILMRLKDAVHDLEPLGGLQVHRSWWINPAFVERTETGKNGPELLMQTGQRVPVGRNFRAALKTALQAGA
ncbi:LytTR family DNA-binding domain-containing protein [Thalassococcus sp. S3]|uniref:LytTR family DNA-binding domain-containing protein n=1 Tax=Thalassococcus sp. S3 TaxID=2017482 RepID=UPI00102460C7|nr:LytTR family DNA-binding domain-containing protein [Thalassococcus sp. S3]QBF32632.1 histidine kinase [Thalassococcus sp. S3]